MAAKPHEHESLSDSILRPFAGWLLGPAAWAAHDELSYLLASWAGQSGIGWTLHLITLALLAVAAAGGLVSWRSYNRLKVRNSTEDRGRGRSATALIGAIVAALSFLGILMEAAGFDLEFVYRYAASAADLRAGA